MTAPALRVLAVASEAYPLVKTGGLADVVGALPAALAAAGVETRTLLPGYPAVLKALAGAAPVNAWPAFFGGAARLLAGRAGALDLFALDAPHLYDRPGNPYIGPDGADWPDNALRFAALARAGADVARGALAAWRPDVVHAHDWQAALLPAYLRYGPTPAPRSVVTVHNLAFQGQFPRALLASLGLPEASFAIDGVEYYGAIGFLKAGLQLADAITTVSPTYALEIQGPEAGMGLDGLLRTRSGALHGILNGVDVDVWNPQTDRRIAATYAPRAMRRRVQNRTALQRRLRLEEDDGALLIGVVSRLSWQKGLDLLLECLPTLFEEGAQLALLGAGDADLESAYRSAASSHPGRVGLFIGYDEDLAHLVQAGADALLVPSRFEPCGLTQLCALRYGAVPIVARVGGLADTIVDANEMALAAGVATGVQFAPGSAARLSDALRRAAALHCDRAVWSRLQTNGMNADVSWTRPARRYVEIYRRLARNEPLT
ncbi:MAG: glycogen synthase GlgA [Methylobacteriaceae bacterium]|nr:glycogen synthase GlgA [Methylobacteriaceae bacterium]